MQPSFSTIASTSRQSLKRKAQEATIQNAERMSKAYNKRHKTSNFNVGDTVSIFVPRIDRSGTDFSRIPGVITKVSGHKDINYQIGTEHGILKVCSQGGDLQHYNGTVEVDHAKTISLRRAALLTNGNRFTQGKCNCKSSCTSNRCSCKKNGITCSTHCHQSTNCEK